MTQEIKEKTEAAEMKRDENKAKKKLQSEIFLKCKFRSVFSDLK